MSEAYERTTAAMGTVVSVMLVGGDAAAWPHRAQRALDWFARVETLCSRFDASSELRRLCERVDEPVTVSALLFEALQFALAVAEASGGAFDPTLGALGEARGFDRHWRTGDRSAARLGGCAGRGDGHKRAPARVQGWRALTLDPVRRTVTLAAPLVLDLGALAKGLAVDLAARDLADIGDFAIDAGGDLYVSGSNADGAAWSVGIRDATDPGAVIARVQVRNMAVCTSGDYARASSDGVSTHLIDPETGGSATRAISATVVASQAMVADALATAAYVLGPTRGVALLERHGAEGLIVTDGPAYHMTRGMHTFLDDPAGHAA